MENDQDTRDGIAGTIVPVIESPAETAELPNTDPERREDSVGGTGAETDAAGTESESFPVTLTNPGGDVFKPYGEAAEAFLAALAETDLINSLTITQMNVPSIDAPVIFNTPYCGFPVTKGEVFSIRLNNGQKITA